VDTDSQITAVVPEDSTSGPITVETPDDMASSTTDFVVLLTECKYFENVHIAEVTIVTGEDGTLSVHGRDIMFEGHRCVSRTDSNIRATLRNIDQIRVLGSGGSEWLFISLAGGLFEPGRTAEPGRDEIEFLVNLGAGDDLLEVVGGPFSNAIIVEPGGINLYALEASRDADVQATSIEAFDIRGGPFGDLLGGARGPNVLVGRGGADILLGLGGRDYLYGGAGADTLDGGPGIDWCSPGGGVDTVTSCESSRRLSLEGYWTAPPPRV
jgi:hypothetical protein